MDQQSTPAEPESTHPGSDEAGPATAATVEAVAPAPEGLDAISEEPEAAPEGEPAPE